jgi:hypothetical protein
VHPAVASGLDKSTSATIAPNTDSHKTNLDVYAP